MFCVNFDNLEIGDYISPSNSIMIVFRVKDKSAKTITIQHQLGLEPDKYWSKAEFNCNSWFLLEKKNKQFFFAGSS